MKQIPGVVWTSAATLIIFIASYFFGADQVGSAVSLILTAALTLVKGYDVLFGDDEAIGVYSAKRSKLNRFLFG